MTATMPALPTPGPAPTRPVAAALDLVKLYGSDKTRVVALDHVTVDDLTTLRSPGIIEDQYGWGHTGTLDGAKACAWVLHDGTTVAAVVSGQRPATGGDVCDLVLVALTTDLGIGAGDPVRVPL